MFNSELLFFFGYYSFYLLLIDTTVCFKYHLVNFLPISMDNLLYLVVVCVFVCVPLHSILFYIVYFVLFGFIGKIWIFYKLGIKRKMSQHKTRKGRIVYFWLCIQKKLQRRADCTFFIHRSILCCLFFFFCFLCFPSLMFFCFIHFSQMKHHNGIYFATSLN